MRRIVSGRGFVDFFVIFRKTSPDGRTHKSKPRTGSRLLKMEIFLKTPQVREAANHTSESRRIKVWGILETF